MKILKGKKEKYTFSSNSKGIDLRELQKVNKLIGRESGLNCFGVYALATEDL